MTANAPLRAYARRGSRKVEGWLTRIDAEITRVLLEAQTGDQMSGGVAEIGVHHGRYFIELALSLGDDEKAVALDLFEAQHENVDRSGKGDRARFQANLAAFGIDEARVEILQGSSLDAAPATFTDAAGAVRFFSVDGGHWRDLVLNDLRLASTAIAPHGIIALDDWNNAAWPDVTGAYYLWMQEAGAAGFAPLAAAAKLYVCREEHLQFYRAKLRNDGFLRNFRQPQEPRVGDHSAPYFRADFLQRRRGMRGKVERWMRMNAPDLFVGLRLRAEAMLGRRLTP